MPDQLIISTVLHTKNKMQKIIIFTALLATAFAAPGVLSYDTYVPLSKSTLTSSSQVIDHGSTHVLQTPLIAHQEYHIPLAKSTLTQSSQVVNHGSTAVVHAPVAQAVVAHAPIAHTVVAPATVYHAPISQAVVAHAPVYSVQSPVVYKSPDSAITHQSSTKYHSLPFYAYH